MKSKLYTFALTGMVAISSLMSATAFASDGTITINGAITSASCTVKGGAANGDIAVTLDKTSTKALAAAGQSAGFKGFSIKLTACDAALTGAVKASFEAGPNADLTTGRLNLTGTTGTASNIQLQLRNGDGSVIKVGDDSTIKGATIASTSATMNYMVGYYATGVPTAGTANSTVTYSIIYP